jgi:hypothetical protein
VSRTWIGAVALSLAVGGVLAPAAASAATPEPTASVTPSATPADEMATYVRSGSGFTPNSTVTVAVTQPNGDPYPAIRYTPTHATDANGSFSGWNWIWTYGDPYGTYTFTFSDAAGHRATATVAITHTPTAPVPAAGTHLMMDTSSAPALTTVQAWQHDGGPYNAIGVYIPTAVAVDNRHDKDQLNLNPDWVSGVQDGGWKVVPIHVGLQAPESCQYDAGAFHEMDADATKALAQGKAAADSAAEQAELLGIDRSVPVISDIEAYKAGCVDADSVQAYVAGWTNELHHRGWLAGVYGGVSSLARDLASAKATSGAYVLPDVLWTATDNRHASTQVSNLPAESWKIANQYLLGINRTYGDTSLTIDETAVDDAVWSLGPVRPPVDKAAPIVMLNSAPSLVRSATVPFNWAGVDADSGIASYDVRTMRTGSGRGSDAYGGVTTVSAATTRTSVTVAPGERVCLEVRAVDKAGNRSAWTRPACSTRLADDRSAKVGPGWKRIRQASAYAHTLTTTKRKKAVLTLGSAVRNSRLTLVHAGGPLTVSVGGRKVATIRGGGTSSLTLPRSGKVTLTTSTAKKVTVDAYALVPGT